MNRLLMSNLTPAELKLSQALTPQVKEYQIEDGQFLDTSKTSAYKAEQLALFHTCAANGMIPDDAVILFHDVFYPGLESVRYVSELRGFNWKVAAFNFAGRADPQDFVQKLGKWSDFSETSWHLCCDVVLVGSEFHKAQVEDYLAKTTPNSSIQELPYILACGYPFDAVQIQAEAAEKTRKLLPLEVQSVVAWPHRIASEKGYELFELLVDAMPDVNFLILSGRPLSGEVSHRPNLQCLSGLTKKQYLHNLTHCKWFLATGKQETFGYALHEAQALGCKPICPNVACYPEFVHLDCQYNLDAPFDEIVRRIRWITEQARIPKPPVTSATGDARTMIHYLRKLLPIS